MNRRAALLRAVALALLLAVPAAAAQTVAEPDLQARLLALGERDQAMRTGLGACRGEAQEDLIACAQRMHAIDQQNISELHGLLWNRGWPLASRVGEDAAFAAFLVIQHADLGVQAAALPSVAVAVWQGELRPAALALLTDRVRIRLGTTQLYGTQSMRWPLWPATVRLPVEAPEQLNQRRNRLSLHPLP